MLTRVYSEAFKENNEVRPIITFRKGLNTVRGAENAKNSIGKSTFLNVIDFAFGGSTLSESKPIKDNVGTHTIFFTFSFSGVNYHFSRSTGSKDIVKQFEDSLWEEEKTELSNKEFCLFLKEQYLLEHCESSWRTIVSRFFRIQAKANLASIDPLQAAHREEGGAGIKVLQELFGVYQEIASLDKSVQQLKEDIAALSRVNKLDFESIKSLKSKKARESAEVERTSLIAERDRLLQNEDLRQIQFQMDVSNRQLELKQKLSNVRSKQNYVRSEIKKLENIASVKSGVNPQEVSDLLEFFPNADTRTLTEVENFHKELAVIVNEEISEEISKLKEELDVSEKFIGVLRTELTSLHKDVEMDESLLQEIRDLDFRIMLLNQQIKYWDEQEEIKEHHKVESERLDSRKKEINFSLQRRINNKITDLSDYVSDGEVEPPRIEFSKTGKSFVLSTPNDDGSGTNDKGVILFDLALLDLTPLPAVAHDSPLIKNLDNSTVGRILQLYRENEKQIFIAFDRHKSYSDTPEIKEIIEETTVIQLGSEGRALYGKAWNKKVEKEVKVDETSQL